MEGIECHKCGQRPAVVKVVRIVDGQARSVYLCQECAADASPFQPHKGFSLQEVIEKALQQLLQKQSDQGATGENGEAATLSCPACGLTFGDYRKSFLLGCSRCYRAFGGVLDPQLRKLHGSTRHVGRVPGVQAQPTAGDQPAIAELKKDLERAVTQEDFEKAAELRDRIRLLQDGSDHVYPKMPKM